MSSANDPLPSQASGAETQCQFCGSRKHTLAECGLNGAESYRREFSPAPSSSPVGREEALSYGVRCATCGEYETACTCGRSPADAAREEGRKPVEFEDLLGSVEDAGDDFFRAFTSRPCNICGRRRNYRVDGQLQVVCHACANPQSPALPSAGEEEIDALADRVREGIYGDDRQTMTQAQEAVDALNALLSRLRAAEQWATYWHAEWERTEKLFQETSRAALTRTPDPQSEGGQSE